MIRPQRNEGAFPLPDGVPTLIMKETGPAEFDRVFCYRLDGDVDATATITLVQRGKFDEEHRVVITVARGGAGRVRVHGSVEVNATAVNATTLHFCTLEAGYVEPVPPRDVLETRTGNGIAGPGPWSDVGAGWCAAERYTVDLATAGAIDFRFIDLAGAQFAVWTVTGVVPPIVHPPRLRLQARNPTAMTTTGFSAVWR